MWIVIGGESSIVDCDIRREWYQKIFFPIKERIFSFAFSIFLSRIKHLGSYKISIGNHTISLMA